MTKETPALLSIRISGKSMRPFFGNGSSVKAVFCPPGAIRIGDIAVFKDDSGFICHRVLRRIQKDGVFFFKTKGDAVLEADPLIDGGRILGKVISKDFYSISLPVTGPIGRVLGLCAGFIYPVICNCFFFIRKAACSLWRTA